MEATHVTTLRSAHTWLLSDPFSVHWPKQVTWPNANKTKQYPCHPISVSVDVWKKMDRSTSTVATAWRICGPWVSVKPLVFHNPPNTTNTVTFW